MKAHTTIQKYYHNLPLSGFIKICSTH